MELFLIRKDFLPSRTFGELYNEDKFIGHILEDKVRQEEPFVLGETAIPYGRYRLAVTFSNRFKKQMIQLFNVRGGNATFHDVNIDSCGIRIHGGNTEKDTLGCPLLGKKRDADSRVYDCSIVNDDLINEVKLADQTQEVYLNVVKQEVV